MLNSNFTGEVMVFASDFQDRRYYQVGISKKELDGSYKNGYFDCKFRKGVELHSKTKIDIKKAWLDFYIKDKKTIVQLFISEFDVVDAEPQVPTGFTEIDDDCPF